MKKTLILLSLLASSFITTNVFATSIDYVYPVDNKDIDITVSSDISFPYGEVSGDVKILKDLEIIEVKVDDSNSKKVSLYLLNPISPNFEYSIISVWDAEWSMEFSLWTDSFWEIQNSLFTEKNIEKIFVQDSTIEVYYNYDIPLWWVYDFKLLKELKVEKLSSDWNNILNVELWTPLEKYSSYILMISSLSDVNGTSISFDSQLYDFFVDDNLLELDTIDNGVENNELLPWDLNSGVLDDTQQNVVGTGNLEDIALSTKEVPQTWPEIWIIFVATLILTGVLFIKNRA